MAWGGTEEMGGKKKGKEERDKRGGNLKRGTRKGRHGREIKRK